MRITFYGAAGCVTGSNYLLETNGKRFLIDCGMFQESNDLQERNYTQFPYNAFEIDAVFITHAHVDHSGLLPKLVKEGYKNPIFLTRSGKELTEIILYDSAHIQEMDLEWKNKKRLRKGLKPFDLIYNNEDVAATVDMIREVPYDHEVEISENIRVKFKESGHIIGSAFIEFFITEDGITKKIIFTGDLGRSNQAIIRNPDTSDYADVIITESTYGNRCHKSNEHTNEELLQLIKEVVLSNGTLIIPSFALGRTQEMIFRLYKIFKEYYIPRIKIYIDSPMADRVTEVYKHNPQLYDEETKAMLARGENPFEMDNLYFTKTTDESVAINKDPSPKIIISSSGMCEAGRILHHLKHHLWQKNSHVLFVGYQAAETLGRRLVDGAKEVKIFNETIKVNATIHTIGGLSAHADKNELLAWLSHYKECNPEVFVVHGDPLVINEFANYIKYNFGFNTHTPRLDDVTTFRFKRNSIDISVHNEDKSVQSLDSEIKRFETLISAVSDEIKRSHNKSSNKQNTLYKFLKKINAQLRSSIDDIGATIKPENNEK